MFYQTVLIRYINLRGCQCYTDHSQRLANKSLCQRQVQRVPWTRNQFQGNKTGLEICTNIFTLPQFADIIAALAEFVNAGVRTGVGVEGAYGGVGDVGAGGLSAGEREDTADSKGGGTGSRGCSTEAGALRGRVASSIETSRTHTVGVGKSYYIEN